MKSKSTIIFSTLLTLSIALNVYLFLSKNEWKEAWVNQFIATSDVEKILKESDADISFSKLAEMAINRPELYMKVIELTDDELSSGTDKKSIKINETVLLFKDGVYTGSKANLPNH